MHLLVQITFLCSLCNRFLSKYPEYPKMNQFIEIGLDDVAKDLSKKTFSSFNERKQN